MKVVLFLSLFLFPFYGEGAELSQSDLKTYKNLPENIETYALQLKSGFDFYLSDWPNINARIPLLLELNFPLNPSSNLKSSLQAGFDWIIQIYKVYKVCDDFWIPEEPLSDSEFFRDNYNERLEKATNIETCRKKTKFRLNNKIPRLFLQPGLSYDFGNWTGAIRAGASFSLKGKITGIGSLSIGQELWDLHISGLWHEDQFYFGFGLSFGLRLKRWTTKNPFFED